MQTQASVHVYTHECLDSRESIHYGDVRIDVQIAESKPRILYDMEPSPFDSNVSV